MQSPQTAPTAPVQATPKIAAGTQDYAVLKAREKELKNQLSDVQDRRDELSRQASNESGASRAGLEGRVAQLDQRLAQIETDLSTVGKELAATAPKTIAERPTRIVYRGFDEGDMWGAGFTGVALTVALFVPLIVRTFRRKRKGLTTTPQPAIATDRIDRMENAIDSIAVEIERVSENQRFMTRLLTETQLAGTIAAVRGSAEAAKAAAEVSTNAR